MSKNIRDRYFFAVNNMKSITLHQKDSEVILYVLELFVDKSRMIGLYHFNDLLLRNKPFICCIISKSKKIFPVSSEGVSRFFESETLCDTCCFVWYFNLLYNEFY